MRRTVSKTFIAQRYGRDHKSIVSGINRAIGIIKTGHALALILEGVCHKLTQDYGRLDIWESENMKRPLKFGGGDSLNAPEHKAQPRYLRAAYYARRNREIVEMRSRGATVEDLAEQIGVSRTQIWAILRKGGGK